MTRGWVTILLKLPRLLRLRGLTRRLGDIRKASAFRLLQLYLITFILNHWAACLWYLICLNDDAENGWLQRANLIGLLPFDTYLGCLYTTTLMLFLSIDVPPQTRGQRIFAIAFMMLGAAAYGTIFGSVSAILNNLDVQKNAKRKKHVEISTRMHRMNLPKELRSRVYRYFDAIWAAQGSLAADEGEFLSELSEPLAKEIRLFMYRDLLMQFTWLHDLPHEALELIIAKVCFAHARSTTHVSVRSYNQCSFWMEITSFAKMIAKSTAVSSRMGRSALRVFLAVPKDVNWAWVVSLV